MTMAVSHQIRWDKTLNGKNWYSYFTSWVPDNCVTGTYSLDYGTDLQAFTPSWGSPTPPGIQGQARSPTQASAWITLVVTADWGLIVIGPLTSSTTFIYFFNLKDHFDNSFNYKIIHSQCRKYKKWT